MILCNIFCRHNFKFWSKTKIFLLAFICFVISILLFATLSSSRIIDNGNGGGEPPSESPVPPADSPKPPDNCECQSHSDCGDWCCFACVCDPCAPTSCTSDSQCGDGRCCINGQCTSCSQIASCSEQGYYSTNVDCVNANSNQCNCVAAVNCSSVSVAGLNCFKFNGCTNSACSPGQDDCQRNNSSYYKSETECVIANQSKCQCLDAVKCTGSYVCTRVIRDPESGHDCAEEIYCYSFARCEDSRCQGPITSITPTVTPTITPSQTPTRRPCDCQYDSDCSAGYHCDGCHCARCQEEKKCRENSVWLYDTCNGPLYESDDCSRYSYMGQCNIQKCLQITTAPTYKKTYRSTRAGVCVDSIVTGAYCSTTNTEEDCGLSTYCSFGCFEQAGLPNCLPKAVITSQPYLEEANKTINVFENDRVELSCLDSIDPDGNISRCEWEIGADYYDWAKITIHATLGSKTVKLKACDSASLCDYDYAIINAVKRKATGQQQDPISENMPPIACFEVSPLKGLPSITEFTFDASCSSDPDAGDFITSYSWDFGDGSKASGKKVTHTYSDISSKYMVYTVTLIVSDNGKDGTKQKMSAISMKKILVGKEIETLRLIANPDNGMEPLIVLFIASKTDDKNFFTNYEWDFGDGITRSGDHELFHAYRSKGTYLARVLASNQLGFFALGSAEVNVTEAKGITGLHVKDTHLYGLASISTKCVSSDTISIEFGTENNRIKLSGFPCNTTSTIGPLVEPGRYTITAEIMGCDALECKRSTSFYVSPELPEVKTPEINPIAILIMLLIVLFIAKRAGTEKDG
ncbi:MAG: PKD domain-containing protein [Candidatus Diapherotrites archaeon]|nr:PKD domain-containing protein [Candidatus Diapherotrites archaeon]